MPATYSVTEPHPTVPKTGSYLYGGRGGAGNYKRYQASELSSGPSATGPASRVPLARPAARTVLSGRGGMGNKFVQPVTEEPMFMFDEELNRREKQAPVYHIGRGGAANFVNEAAEPRVSRSESMDSRGSAASSSSVRGVFNRLSRKLSNQS